jgi:hypothetical protein
MFPRFLNAANALSIEQWREDLHYLSEQIPKVHPGAFHATTPEQFYKAVAELDAQIPRLSDNAIEVELARLVASLGEGHSRLSLPGLSDPMSDVPEITPFKDPRLAFRTLPIQLYWFSNGIFVLKTTQEYQSLVNARVLKIGGNQVDSVLEQMKPLVNQDNSMGFRLIAPQLAVVPEILWALHLIPDPTNIELTLLTANGREESVSIKPLAAGSQLHWAKESEGLFPPSESQEGNFRISYLPESKSLVLRISVIQDSKKDGTVAQVALRLNSSIKGKRVDRFVVDLRECHGGDNQKFRALLLEILRSTELNRAGRFFSGSSCRKAVSSFEFRPFTGATGRTVSLAPG